MTSSEQAQLAQWSGAPRAPATQWLPDQLNEQARLTPERTALIWESGSLDFASLFDQLRADNYQGYVVYECRVRADDPAQAYRDSLTYLRKC